MARSLYQENKTIYFSDRSQHVRDRPFVKPNDTLGFNLISGYTSQDVNINSLGYRGSEFDNDWQDHYKILAIGGSTTFGWGVSDSGTYPAYLESILRERMRDSHPEIKVTVINAGVPSFTSVQQKMRLEDALQFAKPDMVLICTGINDYYYSLLSNWYPEVLLFRQPPFLIRWLSEKSSLFKFFRSVGANPNAQADVFNEKALAYFETQVSSMLSYCKKKKVPVFAVAQPFQGELYRDDRFSPFRQVTHTKDFIRQSQLKFWNAFAMQAKRHNAGIIDHSLSINHFTDSALFIDVCHPTSEGNKRIATEIADKVTPFISIAHKAPDETDL